MSIDLSYSYAYLNLLSRISLDSWRVRKGAALSIASSKSMAFVDIKFRPGDKICFGTVSLVANQHGDLVKHECVAHSVAAMTDQSNPASRFPLGFDNTATTF